MKGKNIFWGVFFILAAVVVIASALGAFSAGIGFWTVLASAALLGIIFSSIRHLNFTGILLPLACGYLLYQVPLGLPYISWWILMGAAVLMSIGLHIIFRKKPGHYSNYYAKPADETWCGSGNYSGGGHYNNHGEDASFVDLDGESGPVSDPNNRYMQAEHGGDENHPFAKVRLGAASKYIHGTEVETGYFTCSMGALEVYFDGAQLAGNGADVFVNVSLGAIQLFVPRGWRIEPDVKISLGGIDGLDEVRPVPGAPVIRLSGNVSLGAIEIKYV